MNKVNPQFTIDQRQAHPPAQAGAGPLPGHVPLLSVYGRLIALAEAARREQASETAVYGRIAKEGGGSHEG